MSLDIPRSVLRIAVTDMAALKVRIRSRQRPDPPKFFYQQLPPENVTLLATLPHGSHAVSIPHEDSWRGGPAFGTICPETGLVVIYRLQENCRYEASAVRDRGQEYSLEEFIAIAKRRVREQFGNLLQIPGQYAYATPDKDEWGSILRDDGYVALNPDRLSLMPCPIPDTAERHGHIIQVRAPLYAGDRWTEKKPLAILSRVEISKDMAFAGSVNGAWLSFEEYRQRREVQATVPHEIEDGFKKWMERFTRESGFEDWRFRPGMGFGEATEWWGPRGRRRTVHEGLDFVEGFHGDKVSLIPEGTPARALAAGEVVAVLDDFMGKTVVVRHASLGQPGKRNDGRVFHTLLSHIQSEEPLPVLVSEGDLLGRVGKRAGVRLRPHLHLTGAWIPADFPFAAVGIDILIHPGFTPTVLVDINCLIEENPLCRVMPDDRAFLIDD